MKVFIVTTKEDVQGVYRVLAEDEDAARRRFNEKGASQNWDVPPEVEQLEYAACSLEIESVEHDTLYCCPDGGFCHHDCGSKCWRVQNCAPLSESGWDDWPDEVKEKHSE